MTTDTLHQRITTLEAELAEARRTIQALHNTIGTERNNLDQLSLFRRIVENTPVAISNTSIVTGELAYVNQAYCRLFGYEASELIGMPLSNLVNETEAFVLETFQQTITQGFWQGEVRCRRKDGSTIPTYITANIIYDDQGQAVSIASFVKDLTEQLRAEQERLALQEQIIEAQQAALRELSTPLMPILDHVVVMPIIGSIDTARSQEVMETLLEGIARHNASFAILDITGVRVVDTQVAAALVRSAQAARLLGAKVILTGISPEIAQTLVHIGAELREIIALSSLQQGIAYTLAQR